MVRIKSFKSNMEDGLNLSVKKRGLRRSHRGGRIFADLWDQWGLKLAGKDGRQSGQCTKEEEVLWFLVLEITPAFQILVQEDKHAYVPKDILEWKYWTSCIWFFTVLALSGFLKT